MDVFFRTDASITIGAGHVYRCLTLADKLQQSGLRSTFICADLKGHLGELIEAKGHGLCLIPHELAGQGPFEAASSPAHPSDTKVLADASHTLACLDNHPATMVVVDHYQLDSRWEEVIRPHCSLLVAIDDLANRPHECELLIDQNLGREPADYRQWVFTETLLLTGLEYALLRPEFSAYREASLIRQSQSEFKRVLISFGGTDPSNLTGQTLGYLRDLPEIHQLELVAILGTNAPMKSEVAAQIATMPCHAELIINPPSMAAILAQCDVAVGAAGGSAWERCCLGLPAIIVIQAENQRDGAMALQAKGAALVIEPEQWGPHSLGEALRKMMDSGYRQALAAVCSSLTAGAGADMVAALITHWQQPVSGTDKSMQMGNATLRPMQGKDLLSVYRWRNDPAIRKHMTQSDPIPLANHVRWFVGSQRDQCKTVLIFETEKSPAAFMQFDQLADKGSYEWGFYAAPLAPAGTGTALGRLSLQYAFDVLKAEEIKAKVLKQNERSRGLHKKLGFREIESSGEADGYWRFVMDRLTWQTQTRTGE